MPQYLTTGGKKELMAAIPSTAKAPTSKSITAPCQQHEKQLVDPNLPRLTTIDANQYLSSVREVSTPL